MNEANENGFSAESVSNLHEDSREEAGESGLNTGVLENFHQNPSTQNSAAIFFLQENALNFKNWYHADICSYLLQMVNNNAKCIRVLFPDSGYDDNTGTFKKQLQQLVMLSNILKKPALFISKEPGANNHFICGLVKSNNLLLINPLGITSHDACYKTLAELKKENTINEIWLSSNILQKHKYEKGLVSCGPISLELAIHILTNFTPEELENFWVNNLKTGESTTHDSSGLVYHGINVNNLLPHTLKELGNMAHESAYQNKVCEIHKKHCEQLQISPVECAKNLNISIEDYLSSYKEGAPAQVVFNALIMDKTINNIDELLEYQILINELQTQAEKPEVSPHVNNVSNGNNETFSQKSTKSLKSEEIKINEADQQILRKNPENCVTVNVWKPEAKKSFGHASLSTIFEDELLYISWWPNWRHSEAYLSPKTATVGKLGTFFSNAPAYENRTYEDDMRDEGGRKPDYIIKFYSLNPKAIKEAFKDNKENSRWHVLGNNSLGLIFSNIKFHSCSSLVAYLLQKGGGICKDIYDRCTRDNLLWNGGSISPEHLALVAHEYETKETNERNGVLNQNTGNCTIS